MSVNLSKSKYLSGLQCEKKLWLEINDPQKATPFSIAQQRILNQGTEVGILARQQFPGGVLINFDRFDLKKGIIETQNAISGGASVIYEATFLYDDTYALADIIFRNKDDSWDIIEVKSTLSVKDFHYPDLALQKYVLEGNGIEIKKTCLMHLNGECAHPDLDDLFVIEDVTEKIGEFIRNVDPNISAFKKIISTQDEPDVAIGPQCKDPYECAFKEYCWEFAGDKAVFDIPGLYKDKKVILQDRGILTLEQLPHDFPLPENQWEYVYRILNKDIWIDTNGIREKLKELEYPIHFLDFETDNPAIPRHAGMSPYDKFPFQYSCHVLYENDQLSHYEYLQTDQSDPRRPLIESLLKCIDKKGSIVVYSAGFEKGVLRQLSESFQEYRSQIDSIIDRLWDQLVIFRTYYKHYAFGNTNSLKSVLPVVIPELNYKELEIQGGADAQAVWNEMIKEEDTQKKDKMITELKKYCGMDSLAMVKIHNMLQKVI